MSLQQPSMDRTPLGALSLLSLAASQVKPQPNSVPRAAPTTSVSHSSLLPSAEPSTTATTFSSATVSTQAKGASLNINIVPSRGGTAGSHLKHRRLSSASQSRRRVHEATAATIQAAAVSGLARGVTVVSGASPSSGTTQKVAPKSPDLGENLEDEDLKTASGNGKRKGTIYRCETCSKVYRHPNCLLKHRWEHSPHWREASKFLLSKHQQVQLLEAAAILSHIGPQGVDGNAAGTSLPEDRALWPSYLSGGLLPAPSTKTPTTASKSSNLAARMKHPPTNAGVPKRETSSEEDRIMTTSKSKDSGYSSGPAGSGTGSGDVSSSSVPATNGFVPGAAFDAIEEAARRNGPAVPASSEGTSTDPARGGFYYGSVDAIPAISPPMHPLSTNGTTSASHTQRSISQSLQPQYLSHHHHDLPPYARGGAKGRASAIGVRRRHGRTSSSLSSSYTRSSVRGGADDEDDEDEDDGMEDVGYMSPVSPVYGSAASAAMGLSLGGLALSPNPNLDINSSGHTGIIGLDKASQATVRRRRRGREDDLDFDVLYERDEGAADGDGEEGNDTVDEDSVEDRNPSAPDADAGMEIDMDL